MDFAVTKQKGKMTKSCNYCKQELSIESFSINRATKDGYSNRCKQCMSTIRKSKRKKVSRIKYDINRTEKPCKACGKILPMASFGPNKMLKDGRENKCRECRRAKRKSNAINNFVEKDSKHCSRCKLTLPIEDFSRDSSRDDGYDASCKSCQYIKYKLYIESNEGVREGAKKKQKNVGKAKSRTSQAIL